MKIPTLATLDERRYRNIEARGWHRYFALWPRSIDGHVHWLCFMERKIVRSKYFPKNYFYIYREVSS